MVSVRLMTKLLRNEFFSRNSGHRIKHPFIADTAGAELKRHHVLAVKREGLGLIMIEHSADITMKTGFEDAFTIFVFYGPLHQS